jgi:hypothetical protein
MLAPAGPRCDMCGTPTTDEHSHVVDLHNRGLLCTCRPCALLFTDAGAHQRYRTVPDRRLALPLENFTAQDWDRLQLPVGLVFFFENSDLGRTLAFYPGPAGVTESELPLEAWNEIVAANPELGEARADIEAVIMRAGRGGGFECCLVPIDACYELAGRLRSVWRGFDGGTDAHACIDEFFARNRGTSKSAGLPEPAGVAGSAQQTAPRGVS